MGKKKDVDDRFKRFGTVSFTAISKINDFIEFLEDGKVMASQCNECKTVFFPPGPIAANAWLPIWSGSKPPARDGW